MERAVVGKVMLCLISLAIPCCAASAWAQGEAGEMEKRRAAEMGLQPGMVLDRTTAALAKDLLPEELLRHYEQGGYRNEIGAWPSDRETMGEDFESQTKRNAEALALDAAGSIIEKVTGKQPPYIYGTPFPSIDPNDPQAGVKILWNHYYNYWWNGNNHDVVDLVWVNPTGVDRTVTQDTYFKYYDGGPPDFRSADNPKNLLVQFIAITTTPADLYGTAALGWRYRDAGKRDSVWAYVPALRRVRQVSPANRSDGFLGSDMSQDDGPFFDGKPEDFQWKLVGEAEGLRMVDPFRLRGEHATVPIPGGGWRAVLRDIPYYGYEDKSWTGLAWAPIAMSLVRRKVWIIEGVPKDPQYLYGKIQLWVDQGNWQGAYNRKFSWQGELLNVLQVDGGPPSKTDGEYTTWDSPSAVAQIAENIKMNRVTLISFGKKDDHPVEYHIPLEASFFEYQTLYRFGK